MSTVLPQPRQPQPHGGSLAMCGWCWRARLVVIVAGFITLWLAMSRPDPVVAEDYYQRGIDINKTLEHPEKSLAPAMKGRNHAATPPEAQPR